MTATDRERFPIGNNRGPTNGWVGAAAICGRAIKVQSGWLPACRERIRIGITAS